MRLGYASVSDAFQRVVRLMSACIDGFLPERDIDLRATCRTRSFEVYTRSLKRLSQFQSQRIILRILASPVLE